MIFFTIVEFEKRYYLYIINMEYFLSLFIPKTVILETLRLHFGYLGYHFGDPGIQGVTQQALGGPGVDF